jgi:hypothetical protein
MTTTTYAAVHTALLIVDSYNEGVHAAHEGYGLSYAHAILTTEQLLALLPANIDTSP